MNTALAVIAMRRHVHLRVWITVASSSPDTLVSGFFLECTSRVHYFEAFPFTQVVTFNLFILTLCLCIGCRRCVSLNTTCLDQRLCQWRSCGHVKYRLFWASAQFWRNAYAKVFKMCLNLNVIVVVDSHCTYCPDPYTNPVSPEVIASFLTIPLTGTNA